MAGCRCDHGTIIVDPGTPVPCESCFYVTSHIIACDEEIGPCADSGSQVIETNCANATFSIIYYDTAFENVAINLVEDAWVLTFDTVEGQSTPNTYYEIRYKATCSGGDFDGLSVIGTVTVCIKDLCYGVTCGQGETCDECTGNCVPAELNLGITIQ